MNAETGGWLDNGVKDHRGTGPAHLAYPRAPWLATIGALLAVVGWLPFSALAALDDLTSIMAQLPNSGSYAELWDRFSTDAVMGTYLIVYIVGHLVAYVLLGIALRRGPDHPPVGGLVNDRQQSGDDRRVRPARQSPRDRLCRPGPARARQPARGRTTLLGREASDH